MPDRPVDVSLLCALFVLLAGAAFVELFSTLSAVGAAGEAPHVADRVAWVLGAVAVFLLLFTLLGLVAAITLWSGEPVGLTLGLAFLATWTLGTVAVGLWSEFGAWEAVRAGVGVVLFVHLRRVGRRYVEGQADAAPGADPDADAERDESTGAP